MTTVRTVARKYLKAHGRKTGKKITLDDVWKGFAELQTIQKKDHKKAQKDFQELRDAQKNAQKDFQELRDAQKEIQKAHAETEAAIKETQRGIQELRDAQQKSYEKTEKDWQDLRKTVKKTSRIVGDLGNKFGEDAEHTLIPGLQEKFRRLKLDFDSMSCNRKINDNKHNIHAEIDAYLENGIQTMAVEVKSKLQKADVDNHIKRMEKLRSYADLHGDKRDLYGALAAIVVNDDEREYALENGFFVIEPSGEDVKVTEPAANPKIWQASDK